MNLTPKRFAQQLAKELVRPLTAYAKMLAEESSGGNTSRRGRKSAKRKVKVKAKRAGTSPRMAFAAKVRWARRRLKNGDGTEADKKLVARADKKLEKKAKTQLRKAKKSKAVQVAKTRRASTDASRAKAAKAARDRRAAAKAAREAQQAPVAQAPAPVAAAPQAPAPQVSAPVSTPAPQVAAPVSTPAPAPAPVQQAQPAPVEPLVIPNPFKNGQTASTDV